MSEPSKRPTPLECCPPGPTANLVERVSTFIFVMVVTAIVLGVSTFAVTSIVQGRDSFPPMTFVDTVVCGYLIGLQIADRRRRSAALAGVAAGLGGGLLLLGLYFNVIR